MAVEVGEGFGVVGNHRVEIEGLRVGEVGVGDGSGDGGPIGGEPAAEAVGVVAGAEVVVAGFGVALLAFEFVVLRAGVGVGRALAAERIEIGVVADNASVRGNDAGSAEEVFDVVDGVARGGNLRDALPPEEDVFGGGVARGVGFGEDFAASAIPVKLVGYGWSLCIGFGNTAAVAVIKIGGTSRYLELAFGVPGVGVKAVGSGIAGGV